MVVPGSRSSGSSSGSRSSNGMVDLHTKNQWENTTECVPVVFFSNDFGKIRVGPSVSDLFGRPSSDPMEVWWLLECFHPVLFLPMGVGFLLVCL